MTPMVLHVNSLKQESSQRVSRPGCGWRRWEFHRWTTHLRLRVRGQRDERWAGQHLLKAVVVPWIYIGLAADSPWNLRTRFL
jgi:hypothetical protein